MSENPDKTLNHFKEILIFAPFQPISAPFAPVAGGPDTPEGIEAGKPSTTQQNEEHNRTRRPDAPDGAGVLPALHYQARNGSPQDKTARNEKGNATKKEREQASKPASH